MSVNDVSRFGFSCAGVVFTHRLESGHVHQSSISKADDVVWEEVPNSESSVLQSCELIAFLDHATEEVTGQLECLILHHEEDLILCHAHVVDTTFGCVIVIIVHDGRQHVKGSLQVPVAAMQMRRNTKW